MSSATTTTSHDEIRRWAEQRGGHPAIVSGTSGLLRINFDEPGGHDNPELKPIEWDEFFRIFDENGLAFLREEGASRFNKFVEREPANR